MPISVECPACEHEFHIPNSYGGKRGKCPECGKVFVAPAADSTGPPATSRVRPPQPPPSDNGPSPPVPPPEPLAGRFATADVAEPPATFDPVSPTSGDPPVGQAPVTTSRPVQPSRPNEEKSRKESASRPSKNTPLWIAVGLLSAMLVVCVVLLVKNMRLEGKETVGDGGGSVKEKPADVDDQPSKSVDAASIEPTIPETKLKDLQLDQLWEDSRPAMFRLVAKRGDDRISGLAFAIDERGWLATSYQLVDAAEAVDVSAVGGPSTQNISATGLVAANEERNVAIIAIEQDPAAVLNLEPATPETDQGLAVCLSDTEELKLIQGAFQRLVSFDDLTANSRAIARQQRLDRNANMVWLEHDRRLSASDRGGPLLNLDGKVIGMNTQLSSDSKVGFALPAAYLLELVALAGDKITPFSQDAPALASGDARAFDSTNSKPDVVPKPPARPEPGSLESIDVLRELHQMCKDIDWQPETLGEYALLQDLAEYVYVAKVNEEDEGIEEGLRILVASPAQEVLVDLSETPWPEEADMMKLNALAAEGLKRDGKGIVCYVEITNTTAEAISVDSVPAIACELIGTKQAIVVPVKKDSPKLKRKSRWLLIGKHDSAREFDLRIDDGSEKSVPVIRAKHLLGEPQVKPPEKAPARRRGRR